MILFNLINRLKKLNFDSKPKIDREEQLIPIKPNLHLKINLEDFKKLKNFSMTRMANHYDNFLKKQPKLGSCLLTSTFNAFPMLFDFKENNFLKKMKKLGIEVKITELIKEFPMLKYNKEEKSLNFLKNEINHERPVIGVFMHANASSSDKVHAVAVFGYDQDYMYYFENGWNDVLLINCINTLNLELEFQLLFGKDRNYFKSVGFEEFYDFKKSNKYQKNTPECVKELIGILTKHLVVQNGYLTGVPLFVLLRNLEQIRMISNTKYELDMLEYPDGFGYVQKSPKRNFVKDIFEFWMRLFKKKKK